MNGSEKRGDKIKQVGTLEFINKFYFFSFSKKPILKLQTLSQFNTIYKKFVDTLTKFFQSKICSMNVEVFVYNIIVTID